MVTATFKKAALNELTPNSGHQLLGVFLCPNITES